MKEDDEIASNGLHSSKRLRLSILRSQTGGRSRRLSDSGGPSLGASTSSLAVNFSPEPTSLSDNSFRLSPQNTSLTGADGDDAPGNEENFSNDSDFRQQAPVASNDLLDIPCEVSTEGVAIQPRELHGRQLEDGASHSIENVPAEPGARPGTEVSAAISDDQIGTHLGHDGSPSFREEEADDALLGGEVAGDGPSDHLEGRPLVSQEQDADFTRFPETETEGRPLVSQEQEETLSRNVATFGQSETLILGHTDVLETSVEVVEVHETESGILHAEAVNRFIDTVELSDDEEENEPADPTLTASAFAEPMLTAEDFDAFAPEPHHIPRPLSKEAGTSNLEQLPTQVDSEGTICPICMEPWTSTGNHRICSLACGHLFGKDCIKRWLKLAGKKQAKCPHCNKRARVEDIRTLYVARIAVADGETQQFMEETGVLRTENEKLKKQLFDLREEVRRTQTLLIGALSGNQRDAFSMLSSSIPRPQDQRVHRTSGNRRGNMAHHAARPAPHRPHGSINHHPSTLQSAWSGFLRPAQVGMIVDLEQRRGENIAARPLRSFSSTGNHGPENGFVLQDERSLNGAKVFDMDAQSQLLLVSGKPPDSMTSSGLTKMSLFSLSEGECINLPFGTGAIRDIRIAPTGTRAPGRLALVASLGKKLSLFSLESNNVVITYTLPNPAWACAWDPCDPNRVYTGLQNGTLLTFDMRQTSSPLDTLKGPTSTPVHTLQYVPETGRPITLEGDTSRSGGGGLLSASSNALLFWPGIDQPQEKRPMCISQPGGSSVCVSVAYNAAVDVMVASFRPKPTAVSFNDGASSSASSTYSQADGPSQSTPSAPVPESASSTAFSSVRVQIPTHFPYTRTSTPAVELACSSTPAAATNISWEQQGAMVGHRSQAVLSRTAIVNEWADGRSPQTGTHAGTLFASGDEGSNAVWLWDLTSPTAKRMLSPHPYSPVLDVRTAHVAGVDLLGCISERTLQLYRRSVSR